MRRRAQDRPYWTLRRLITGVLLPLAVIAFALAWTFVARLVAVEQDSMEPTLLPGDRLLVLLRQPGDPLPERGAVVVVQHPDESYWIVKRVIGLPDDDVWYTARGLGLNGRWVNEPYARPHFGEAYPRLVVPPGEVYLLGDNRPRSEDSRDYGPVSGDLIVGEVIAVLWPEERRGPVDPRTPE